MYFDMKVREEKQRELMDRLYAMVSEVYHTQVASAHSASLREFEKELKLEVSDGKQGFASCASACRWVAGAAGTGDGRGRRGLKVLLRYLPRLSCYSLTCSPHLLLYTYAFPPPPLSSQQPGLPFLIAFLMVPRWYRCWYWNPCRNPARQLLLQPYLFRKKLQAFTLDN